VSVSLSDTPSIATNALVNPDKDAERALVVWWGVTVRAVVGDRGVLEVDRWSLRVLKMVETDFRMRDTDGHVRGRPDPFVVRPLLRMASSLPVLGTRRTMRMGTTIVRLDVDGLSMLLGSDVGVKLVVPLMWELGG
jgi:hypothetical protein